MKNQWVQWASVSESFIPLREKGRTGEVGVIFVGAV